MESIDTILDQNSSLKNKEAFKLDVNKTVQEQAPYAFMSVSFALYTVDTLRCSPFLMEKKQLPVI